MIYDHGLIAKLQVTALCRDAGSKILTEVPLVLEKVSMELGQQKKQLQLSVNSPWTIPWRRWSLSTVSFS
jgi:hypothetical protein